MVTGKVAVLVGHEPVHRYSVHRGYVDALWAAGATPLLLAPPADTGDVDRYVEAALGCDAVCVTGGSAAQIALGGATIVNSIHHQAVRDPGPDLVATAWSPDGLIEAVEAPGVLGLQWHPERLWPTDERHIAPFLWLVAA